MKPVKSKLFQQFLKKLEAQLDALGRTQGSAVQGTRVDGDHRPSNRGERAAVTSQGYLALGLAQRAAELSEKIERLKQVPPTPRSKLANGALALLIDEDDAHRWILVLPGGQGDILVHQGTELTVVSSEAPMLSNLLGKEAGDDGRIRMGGRTLEVEIAELY